MFRCVHCNQEHDGIPAFHFDRPAPYWDVPEDKRETDVFLTSDSCVIAERFFFIRALLEIPIQDHAEKFTFGVWVSLSEPNFFIWQDHYETEQRSHIGPFFGWFCSLLPVYPETLHMKTSVHLRDHGIRPWIDLEETEHPLSRDYHQGITLDRALEMMHLIQEGKSAS